MITVLGTKLRMSDLEDIPVLRPEKAGSRWQGVNHHQLVSTIHRSLRQHDLEILTDTWSTDKNGQVLVGGLGLGLLSHELQTSPRVAPQPP